jgi:hypothetical protein
MANSIDQLNYYDPLVNPHSRKMSEEWISQMSSFIDVLNDYLTPFGILTPQVTTEQRDSIQSPVLGQLIYNTTTNELQVYQIKTGTAAWRAITTVP